MRAIQAELENRKRALAQSKAQTQTKYLKRSQLDAHTTPQHNQEEKEKEKETTATASEALHLGNVQETIQQLRSMDQPATLFGEDAVARQKRLEKLKANAEKIAVETEKSKLKEKEKEKEEILEDIPKNVEEHARSHFSCDEDFVANWIEVTLNQWGFDLKMRGDDSNKELSLLKETRSNLSPLLERLRSRQVPQSMLRIMSEISNFAMRLEYIRANDSYMQLAIGNSPWPMGVTAVGIHERSASDRIQSNKVARKF
jgi:pre-mRNA-splicing factor 18